MEQILLDCDPGHEDFFGLMLAIAHPDQIQIQAIETTVQYQTADNVQRNAMKALELLGVRDVPVV